jgi:hypothetical protein
LVDRAAQTIAVVQTSDMLMEGMPVLSIAK